MQLWQYKGSLERSKANLQRNKANLESVENNLWRNKANLQRDSVDLEREIGRVEKELMDRQTPSTHNDQCHQTTARAAEPVPAYCGSYNNAVNPLTSVPVNDGEQVSSRVPADEKQQPVQQDTKSATGPSEFNRHHTVYRRRREQSDHRDRHESVPTQPSAERSGRLVRRSPSRCRRDDESSSSSDRSGEYDSSR